MESSGSPVTGGVPAKLQGLLAECRDKNSRSIFSIPAWNLLQAGVADKKKDHFSVGDMYVGVTENAWEAFTTEGGHRQGGPELGLEVK